MSRWHAVDNHRSTRRTPLGRITRRPAAIRLKPVVTKCPSPIKLVPCVRRRCLAGRSTGTDEESGKRADEGWTRFQAPSTIEKAVAPVCVRGPQRSSTYRPGDDKRWSFRRRILDGSGARQRHQSARDGGRRPDHYRQPYCRRSDWCRLCDSVSML